MKRAFTAVVKQDAGWWIGWVEEVTGVNCQGKTREELLDNLRSALAEALALNREEALRAASVLQTTSTSRMRTSLRA